MTLSQCLAEYLSSARQVAFDEVRARAAAHALLERALAQGPDGRDDVVTALVDDVARQGPSLTISASVAGALVEQGAPHAAFADALLPSVARSVARLSAALADLLARDDVPVADAADEAAEDELIDWVRERLSNGPEHPDWELLEDLHAPSVAVLGVSAEHRARFRGMLPALRELEAFHHGAAWLRRMLDVLDHEPLVVLHVPTRVGWSCSISGMTCNADLFVLLAHALSQSTGAHGLDVAPPPASAIACLRGEGARESGVVFECPWTAYAFTALRADQSLPDATDFSMASAWIWGEGEPVEIPALDGQRVILLGPPTHARVHAVERTFETLRAELVVEPLAADVVETWVLRIARANAG